MGRPRWCTWAAGSVTRSARGRCWTAPTPVSTDGRTHVLLPVGALVRRADAAVVIGAALVAKAAGWGHRRIAVWPDPDPPVPEPAGSQVADAVEAIIAAAGAVGRRWGLVLVGLSPWELAAAVTAGRLLGPSSTVEVRNTSCPW